MKNLILIRILSVQNNTVLDVYKHICTYQVSVTEENTLNMCRKETFTGFVIISIVEHLVYLFKWNDDLIHSEKYRTAIKLNQYIDLRVLRIEYKLPRIIPVKLEFTLFFFAEVCSTSILFFFN